ncbi:DUF1508 domain-containing protein [Natrialbaceae archaeon GCM10025810]|uniref:DUF1508 domain-containing protein n=1 Tax=Halovalidus salilacus TaxID=3075124 RepID=UPI003621520F
MSSSTSLPKKLFRLYEHYVGEPDSESDVWGYWIFIFGYLVGAAGLGAFIVGYAGTVDSYFHIRVSGVAAAAGLAFCLFGLVLMLPVRKRAIQAGAVGLVVALAGVVAFAIVYPYNWRDMGAGLEVEVIAIYSAGIAIIAGVTALVPVVTGRKGMFVEEEGQTEDPPILTGDALEGAQFAVFRDDEGDWGWHVLHLEALAGHQESAATRPEAKAGIERVKSKIGSAGLMELTTSAFRLYQDADETWRWTLVRDDGSVVAECTSSFDARDGAEQSVSFLKDRGPDADVIEIDGAAFTYVEERDEWHWELLDADRRALATSPSGHLDQGDAEEAAMTFAEHFDRARLLDVDHVGVELRESADGWTWRFVDAADDELARSATVYDSRRDAEEAVEALLPELEGASITVSGEPTYELYESGDEWRWRLVDESEHVVARNPEDCSTLEDAERTSERFSDEVDGATVVEIEDAEYEIYPAEEVTSSHGASTGDLPATVEDANPATDGGTTVEDGDAPAGPDWNWRLVTEDREIVAASTEPHAGPDAAAEAIERVRQQASEADLIEFENAAFQVYEADSGEWRWRLIDEDGNVLADSGEEHTSRNEAAEAMMTLKKQAPDADVIEIDTAAFELFVNDDGEWGWRLIDEGGKLVAEDPATHPTRAAAKQAMERLLEHLDSDIRTMDGAIFQTYPDGDDWHWRFILPDGDVVAVGDEAYPTRDELVDGIEDVRDPASRAGTFTIGDVAVQLYESGEWHFRLLDRDREIVADSSVTFDDRATAIDAVEDLERHAPGAPIFTIEDAAIRLERGEGGWRWQLIDADREVLATAATAVDEKEAILETVEEVRRLAPIAGRVDFDVASFDVYAVEDDRWSWRLIDEDGRTVADGTETYSSSDAARNGLEPVRELIDHASILEIDGVSFELHAAEDEDGWVWHLVDKHGSTLSESTRTYESRTDAREAMNAVKRNAPDGWITFTE